MPKPLMDVTHRLDPVLLPFAAARTDLSAATLPALRDGLNQRRMAAAAALDTAGVTISEAVVPASRPVGIRVYRGAQGTAPAVIHCHSGAFVLGNLDIDHRQCVEFARRGVCTVIAVDYRLAPEHPYPAAVDDVVAVLEWTVANAAELQIDPARVALSGNSAGGGLAATLAVAARDGRVPPIAFQMLHQPVLDDRPTPSKAEFATTPGFDGPAAEAMWRHYLDGMPPSTDSVPARVPDLAGLPPTLITCSELDPLRDEALDHARRLLLAGVATELHVYPRTCHGFDSLLPEWDTSAALFDLQGVALRRTLFAG